MKLESSLHYLGIILQFNGIILIFPTIVALIYNENFGMFSLTALISFILGFIFSNFFKKKELDTISAYLLIFLAFIFLSILGLIPYLMANIFEKDAVINSIFESVSGYTTTGLTLISNVESLPKSLIFYRSIIQWIGGVSIIFLFLVFFSTSREARILIEISGFEQIGISPRETFLIVMRLYIFYTLLFILLLYTTGIEIFIATNLVLAGISTGGFVPVNDLDSVTNLPSKFIIMLMMFLGSISFFIHYRFWRKETFMLKKVKEIKRILNYEFIGFIYWIFLIFLLTLIYSLMFNLDIIKYLFNILSTITTTGYFLGSSKEIGETMKVSLLMLMFIGGCYFSTASGIKFLRFIILLTFLPWIIKRQILPSRIVLPIKLGDRTLSERDFVFSSFLVFFGIVSIFFFSIFFTFHGISYENALFELTSAFTNAGLTSGITNVDTPSALKLILIFQMIIGRIEVIPFLVVVFEIYRWITTKVR
jgi:trk system potassium uptake protein TrkH